MESCISSAYETCKLKPSLCRLYPTIVLEDTRLCEMYHEGIYEPLSRKDAVKRTAIMYRILDQAGIYIMRVGLKSNDIVSEDGKLNGGTFHPAFRQLVESYILREDIENELKNAMPKSCKIVTIYSSPKWYSNLVGNRSENRKYFEAEYPTLKFRFKVDSSLESHNLRFEYL